LNLKTKKENINQDKNSEIPEKMKEAFDRMKKTMLTKSTMQKKFLTHINQFSTSHQRATLSLLS